jgi:hypothetical protein
MAHRDILGGNARGDPRETIEDAGLFGAIVGAVRGIIAMDALPRLSSIPPSTSVPAAARSNRKGIKGWKSPLLFQGPPIAEDSIIGVAFRCPTAKPKP